MTITTEEAERLASRHNKESHAWTSDGANHDLAQFHAQSAAALFYLAAERDALQKRVAKLERLVEILVENDPDDMAADAVTVLDVWRKEAREALEGKKDE